MPECQEITLRLRFGFRHTLETRRGITYGIYHVATLFNSRSRGKTKMILQLPIPPERHPLPYEYIPNCMYEDGLEC